ncbi:MAG: hypothetical protein KGK30_02695, partial [Elusimicrobia bacterium]|nr:hypothetical protein [Elusimicrobiota bacterium]
MTRRLTKRVERGEKRGTIEPEKIARLLAINTTLLKKIPEAYRRSDWMVRLIGGLNATRRRALRAQQALLELAAARVSELPEDQRPKALAKFEAILERMPAYAYAAGGIASATEGLLSAGGEARVDEEATGSAQRRLRLLRRVRSYGRDADAGAVFKSAQDLAQEGLYDLARRLLNAHRTRLLAHIFSPAGDDPEGGRAFAKLHEDVASRTDSHFVHKRPFWPRLWRNFPYLRARINLAATPIGGRLWLASLSPEVARAAPAAFSVLSPGAWLQRFDRWALRRYLSKRISSIRQLSEFVDGLKRDNILVDNLSTEIQAVIVRHPEWIESDADLSYLIADEAFWPKFGATTPGPLEAMLVASVKSYAQRFPDIWKFDPGSSEKLQSYYLAGLRKLGEYPGTWEGRRRLWRLLVTRGVTSATDALFSELYREAPAGKIGELEEEALGGRIWEQGLKAGIVENRIKATRDYRRLLLSRSPTEREALLRKLLAAVQAEFPERSVQYVELLERMSREIDSSQQESRLIHEAKTIRSGERSEDFGLRVFSELITEAVGWKRREQWDLVLFLRGDIPATRKIQRAFRSIGPERVRRLYEVTPVLARAGILDSFLDSPKGLLASLDIDRGYAKVIIDHVLPGGDPAAREVAHQILEGFLYSLKKTGNGALQSYVLSYLLALPPEGSASVGKVLKGVLEIFGTTGVKIGQFLAASQLLPESETAELRQLQEHANEPEREEVYSDLRAITGRPLPFALKEILGAASIKYAVRGVETGTQQELALKVFRLEAVAHTRAEFEQLDAMARYLRRRFGARYGVFMAIVKAARKAVERELSAEGEIANGRQAAETVYSGASDKAVDVAVPREALLHSRLIASEFAQGTSFFDLDPALRPLAAAKILSMEGNNLFGDAPEIHLDPDRHAGNYRIQVVEEPAGPRLRIRPIDHGQGLALTRARREQIFELFALAQILARTGSTRWGVDRISSVLGLGEAAKRRLGGSLDDFFTGEELRPVAAYYSLLAVLEESGHEMDIVYFDFVR